MPDICPHAHNAPHAVLRAYTLTVFKLSTVTLQSPKVCQNPDARIQLTNRYCDDYRRVGLSMKCYWWRGIQPLEETTPVRAPRASYHMLGTPASSYRGKKITVYTDGSGGKYSADPRLRRCGWAWVCPQINSNKIAVHGARGALDGKQTVPRAELRAILECLNDLK